MINVRDMTELLYIQDAYHELKQTLFGAQMDFCANEGVLGRLDKILELIVRNSSLELIKDEYDDILEIAENTSIPPEEWAKMLLQIK